MRTPGRGRAFARRIGMSAAGALAAFVALTGPAPAATVLSDDVTVDRAVERSCTAAPLSSGGGYAQRSVSVDGGTASFITARLKAPAGDWDVAVFDGAGDRVVGSSFFGADEIAQGFVTGSKELTVQACRRSGSARSAKLSVETSAIPDRAAQQLSLVRVMVPNAQRKAELTELGLDLTEHGRSGFVEVVLHGERDRQVLRENKFLFTTEVADLVRSTVRDNAATKRYAQSVRASALPSGRTTYRRLSDYTDDMKKLVDENPNLVKPITLPFKTLTGMSVNGIEITSDVNARDGKPVFLQMGVHHAREWPSSENAMESAFELVNGFKSGNARIKNLVESTRTIVIPIVNPEGFNTSREAGEMAGVGGGRPGTEDTETANLLVPYEYQRKNCRINSTDPAVPDPEEGDCTQMPAVGLSQFGVDPNRNYGGFWGGPGAAASGEAPPGGDFAQDYRGDAPFSERETQNIRALVSTRQVTTLITNHTFSNLVLRPPGIQSQGPTVDEPAYKALGDSFAAENGYSSQLSYQLYDTTGGTEDWTYYATGGLGFTFEIGLTGFHPPFAETVAEYEGTSDEAKAAKAGGGGGNREAYLKALENTADPAKHSLITGGAPAGNVLRLKKSFKTSTSPVLDADGNEGEPILFDDTLDSTMVVPSSGQFSWHINPSTRPVVAQAKGRAATGQPSAPIDVPSMTPAAPCGAAMADNPMCYKDFAFTVPSGSGVDNAEATVEVNWATPASDYDITVFEDSNGDGSSTGETKSVGTSAQGPSTNESTTFGEPGEVIAGKKYVVRVVNFLGSEPYTGRISFGGPAPAQEAKTETWTLSCETPGGNVLQSQQLLIARGEKKAIDFGSACPPRAASDGSGSTDSKAKACFSTRGGIKGRRIARAKLGRKRAAQLRTLSRARRLRGRRGIDRYCVKGGGTLRIAYPGSALNRALSRGVRRRVSGRAIALVSSSKRLKLRGLKIGARAKTVRRRLQHERRYKVGKSVWYVARGERSTLLYRTTGGRVRELGVASSLLTRRARGTRATLRASGT